MGQRANVLINHVGTAGMTWEIQEYYRKLGSFDKLEITPPGSSLDPLDQFGSIKATRAGVTKTVLISDVLYQQGFDGIDDMIKSIDRNWESLKELHTEAISEYVSADHEYKEAVAKWRKILYT